jgi:hypothetical protein
MIDYISQMSLLDWVALTLIGWLFWPDGLGDRIIARLKK